MTLLRLISLSLKAGICASDSLHSKHYLRLIAIYLEAAWMTATSTLSSWIAKARKYLLITLLTGSVPLVSIAQDEDSEMEEVVVTATRIPTPISKTLSATTIITAEDIERIKPDGIGDLLNRISGIGFRDSGGRGSAGSLFIRGSSSKHTIILINGIRTSSATLGTTSLINIPLEQIERIEVVKGPLSSLYGADAIGGVIQIFTKKYDAQDLESSISSTIGSNKTSKFSGSFKVGTEDIGLVASLSYENTDGIDRTACKKLGNEDEDLYRNKSAHLSLSSALQDNLDWHINHSRSESKTEYDHGFGCSAGGDNLYTKSKLNITNMRLDYDFSTTTKILFNLGTTTDLSQPKNSYIKTRKYDYSIQGDMNLSDQNQISIGADYHKDKVTSTTLYDKTKRSNKGLFLVWQRTGDKFGTVANVRYDDNQAYGSNSNLNFQQSIQLTNGYQIIASYGTGFQAPSFNDLYWPGFGNPDLLPEESKSYELSLRKNLQHLDWQVNIFQTKIKNLITGQRAASNLKSATIKGIEFELNKQWEDLSLLFNMEYLDTRNDETNKFLDGRARVSANIELVKYFDKAFYTFDVSGEHGRFDSDMKLPGYAVFGLGFGYHVSDNFEISARIDNLTDKDYTTNIARKDPYNPYKNEGIRFELSTKYRF